MSQVLFLIPLCFLYVNFAFPFPWKSVRHTFDNFYFDLNMELEETMSQRQQNSGVWEMEIHGFSKQPKLMALTLNKKLV